MREVLAALEHRRTRQPGDVARAADVVGMHVRDEDPLDRSVELVEHRPPLRLGLGRAEPRVDEQPAARRQPHEVAVDVVEPERERQRDPAQPFLEVDHA